MNSSILRTTRRAMLASTVLLASLATLSFGGVSVAQVAQPFDPAGFAVELQPFAEGFERPVQMLESPDASGRLFVVEQGGRVRVLIDGVVQEEPFLDITSQISTDNEQGLLSIAFHPDFAENQTFFIDYTDVNGDTQVERWRVSADDINRADPASAESILQVDQPAPNHNGGLLLFGPDNFLYVGLGDGGGGGDPDGNGQNTQTLLGSILRIDIDSTTGDLAYGIPADNPFASGDGGRPEIWAYGFRNPWRFSFDRETGDLYIGDVGQGEFEEVSLLPAGSPDRNFGWNVMEGFSCYQSDDCNKDGLVLPIFDYSHDEGGCSVVGGYVYRGAEIVQLQGVYLLADYCSGLLWGLGRGSDGGWLSSDPIETGLNVSSFGEDTSGNLYVLDLNGSIFRVTSPA